jgi:Transglutaminase-like superfamily
MDARSSTATASTAAAHPAAGRFRSPADVRWFLAALRRARLVRRRLEQPLPDTIAALAAMAPVRPPTPEVAWVAAVRASGRLRRLAGGPDTCLVRALIAGSLLAARGDVRLHLGFRPGEAGAAADGHAWLSGGDFELGRDAAPGPAYEPVLSLPFTSPGSPS